MKEQTVTGKIDNVLNSVGNVVTMTKIGGMGFLTVITGKLLSAKIAPYAQHKEALFIQLLPKRKRKPISYVIVYPGYWETFAFFTGEIADQGMWQPEQTSTVSGLITKSAKYSGCDPRWVQDYTDSYTDKVLFSKV